MSNSLRSFLKENLPPEILIHLLAWKNYFYGEPEFRLLREIVDPTRNAIDVGANRGLYTYFLSRIVPKVFAYEPNAQLVAFLRRTVRPNVQIVETALSDQEGEANLHIPLIDGSFIDGWASLSKTFESNASHDIKVRTARLDQQGHSNVGFLKIDVEGHEQEVIEGARGLILAERPVILAEIEQRHLAKPIDEVFDKVLSFGYAGFFARGKTFHPLKEFSVLHDQLRQMTALEARAKIEYINNFVFRPL